MSIRYIPERLLLLLVVATLLVLVFSGPLLETRMVIEPDTEGLRLELDSDVQDGGNTQVRWIDRDQMQWECDLGAAYPYPFCGMQIFFSDSHMQGVDLSRYSYLNLHLDYTGQGDQVRLFLRNSNPAYTHAEDMRSTKFNMVELDLRRGPEYQHILLDYFRIADWWLQLYNLDVSLTRAEFSNVGLIEIQTGTGLSDGVHRMTLKKLELVGVRISLEHLYLGIIVIWILAILTYLAVRIRLLSQAVQQGQQKQEELREINILLDMRSRTLEERIKLDPLTGAYNRAGVEESLANGFLEWKKHRRPLSVLLLDVDYFKSINDQHGHAIGDRVLQELSALVAQNIRNDDYFARWGGEEFIVVSVNTEQDQALEMAEKLRKLIASTGFAEGLEVTVSIGVAQINDGETLEELFARTDQALYQAKDAGRNRVMAI